MNNLKINNRSCLSDILVHPFFWVKEKCGYFLVDVYLTIEGMDLTLENHIISSLNSLCPIVIKNGVWPPCLNGGLLAIYDYQQVSLKKTFNRRSLFDFLQFIQNIVCYFNENNGFCKLHIGDLAALHDEISECFPKLLVAIHRIAKSELGKQRLQSYFQPCTA
ncbi:hypothetical protein AMTRI_Chr12g269340 [Amborella trichopoda]